MDQLERAGELPAEKPATNGHRRPRGAGRTLAERRRIERVVGLPFTLDHDPDIECRVRALTLSEKATILGLPAELQNLMLRGFQRQRQMLADPDSLTLDDLLDVMDTEEETADEVCLAGFVTPRLVRTQAELDASDDPDVAWVKDIHIEDRRKYLRVVTGQDKPGLEAMLAFREQMAGLQDHGLDRGRRSAPSPVRPPEYAG